MHGDRRYPQQPMLDIPIHRASVGAMALAVGSQMPDQSTEFKPYRYRGWGYDLFEEEMGVDYPEPEPPKPPKPKKRKRKKPKPRTFPPSWEVWTPPPEPEPLRIEDENTWGNWQRQPVPEPEPKPARVKWVTRNHKPARPAPPIRPAAGWSATTGDDIDRMLEELGDD